MTLEKVNQAGLEKTDFSSIDRAFSKQALHYDEEDSANPILVAWRKQVYEHVDRFVKPGSNILELNAGTGIDALHFVKQGHHVHCIDISEGMIHQIRKKKQKLKTPDMLICQQCSFDDLNNITGKFDFVFSNFGGLNCIDDLAKVTANLPRLLNAGARVTWVVMPPVCLWEIGWIFKGRGNAFRRFHKNGTLAHLEGEYFKTYYYSLRQIKDAFANTFNFLASEGLGALSPPPYENNFPVKRPGLYLFLTSLDRKVRMSFPFNRWADHIIVTMGYEGDVR